MKSSRTVDVITSSTAIGTAVAGQPATEDHFDPEHLNPRVASELAGRELSRRGLNVSVVRLSQIHDTIKQGLVTDVVALARKTAISAYVDEGLNRWSATHVADAANLFKLALDRQEPGARYHATAEESIAFRLIAQAVAESPGVPAVSMSSADAAKHFGWLTPFVGKDMSASSTKTRAMLGWEPVERGLLADIVDDAITSNRQARIQPLESVRQDAPTRLPAAQRNP